MTCDPWVFVSQQPIQLRTDRSARPFLSHLPSSHSSREKVRSPPLTTGWRRISHACRFFIWSLTVNAWSVRLIDSTYSRVEKHQTGSGQRLCRYVAYTQMYMDAVLKPLKNVGVAVGGVLDTVHKPHPKDKQYIKIWAWQLADF